VSPPQKFFLFLISKWWVFEHTGGIILLTFIWGPITKSKWLVGLRGSFFSSPRGDIHPCPPLPTPLGITKVSHNKSDLQTHPRSSAIMPFDNPYTISYLSSIVTTIPECDRHTRTHGRTEYTRRRHSGAR